MNKYTVPQVHSGWDPLQELGMVHAVPQELRRGDVKRGQATYAVHAQTPGFVQT